MGEALVVSVVPERPDWAAQIKILRWSRKSRSERVCAAQSRAAGIKLSPEADRATLIRRVTLDLTGCRPRHRKLTHSLRTNLRMRTNKSWIACSLRRVMGMRMRMGMARRRPVRGHQRLPAGPDALDVAVAGLGHQCAERWQCVAPDQFTIKQLAGDLLPNSTVDDKVATAFCRNHMINGEGGRIPWKENRVDYVMDQSETVGTVWLGLTVGCCRCHDHKYDPLKQKDYYSLFAFFNNTPVDGG